VSRPCHAKVKIMMLRLIVAMLIDLQERRPQNPRPKSGGLVPAARPPVSPELQ
jgi:hypothetical protein